MTLRQLAAEPKTIPTRAGWYLADLGEAKGKSELFTRQSPQKLKVLREHALIESAISSNRIEGVEVDQSRVATLMFGKPALRDRDEEEVRGYRDALKLIHESGAKLPVSEATIQRLHKLCRGEIWDAGRYKQKDGTSSRPTLMGGAGSVSNLFLPNKRRQRWRKWLSFGSAASWRNGFIRLRSSRR